MTLEQRAHDCAVRITEYLYQEGGNADVLRIARMVREALEDQREATLREAEAGSPGTHGLRGG
ncbi:MAG TPA: hypothetical protein VFU47_05575 [Armatimonadota bacterium]|nr:hypothetical protein [Armatimonadota bacterium]